MSFLYNLFLPSHDNGHRATILRPQLHSFLALIFIFSQIFINFFTLSGAKVLGYSSVITPEKVVELTNLKRSALGLSSLKENSLLSEAARRKAGEMFAFNYWAHNSPSGRDPWSFFKEVGYKYTYAGENLARDFRDTDSVVEAWMNSPSHKENIVNGRYQEIGVAVVEGTLQGVATTLVVQLFGTQPVVAAKKPAQSPAKPAVAQKPAVAAVPEKQLAGKEVISSETKPVETVSKGTVMVNPFSLTKIVVIFLVGVVFGAFLVDMFLVSEKRNPRLSGRSFAQFLFLGFILLLALFSKQGLVI